MALDDSRYKSFYRVCLNLSVLISAPALVSGNAIVELIGTFGSMLTPVCMGLISLTQQSATREEIEGLAEEMRHLIQNSGMLAGRMKAQIENAKLIDEIGELLFPALVDKTQEVRSLLPLYLALKDYFNQDMHGENPLQPILMDSQLRLSSDEPAFMRIDESRPESERQHFASFANISARDREKSKQILKLQQPPSVFFSSNGKNGIRIIQMTVCTCLVIYSYLAYCLSSATKKNEDMNDVYVHMRYWAIGLGVLAAALPFLFQLTSRGLRKHHEKLKNLIDEMQQDQRLLKASHVRVTQCMQWVPTLYRMRTNRETINVSNLMDLMDLMETTSRDETMARRGAVM